ncbi:endonuclease V [Myceligenerans crystallogenes]|uniref:Endonuclease V n=1 Tax=Myceligenerans crystallogenes TaxID=316335 RepID=A0ABN2N544_9MICO
MTGRFGAVDVHYLPEGRARAALVVCPTPAFGEVTEERTVLVDGVAEYRPGNFYERELPPMRALLAAGTVEPLDLLVVDGYVTLDPEGRPGLGAHAHQAGLAPVVVGVAKTRFAAATHAIEVTRGASSRRPLYVTALGLPPDEAAQMVRDMAGEARFPDALRRVDRLARSGDPARDPIRGQYRASARSA